MPLFATFLWEFFFVQIIQCVITWELADMYSVCCLLTQRQTRTFLGQDISVHWPAFTLAFLGAILLLVLVTVHVQPQASSKYLLIGHMLFQSNP